MATDVNAPKGHVPELVWYAQVEKFGAETRHFGCRGTRLLQDMVCRCVFVYDITTTMTWMMIGCQVRLNAFNK